MEIIESTGATERNEQGRFSENRRVVLEIGERGSLSFVAWEPEVVMQLRLPGAGFWKTMSTTDLTADEVERIAKGFLTAVTAA